MAAAWYEEFFGGLYADVLASHGLEESEAEAQLVKKLLVVGEGSQVLDIGCGMGRITLPLAHSGLDMTGVDLTARYIRRARRRAEAEGVRARFVQRDMRHIDFDGEFAAAFSWFTSFGYFPDRDNLLTLKNAHKALRPGGRFLLEMHNKSFILSHFRPHDEATSGGVHVTEDRRYDARHSTMRCVWTLTKGNTTETHRIAIKCYNGTEMRRLLRKAGFVNVRFYGRPPLGRFTRHSKRMIVVAEKP